MVCDCYIDPAKTGASAVTLSIDDKKLGKYLSSLLRDEIDQSPSNAQSHGVTTRTNLSQLKRAGDGIELRPQKLAEAVIASFWGTTKVVEIPVTVTKPEIDSKNLKAAGRTTRLAVGDSSFEGSDYGRSTNVQVGSSLLNGTLIHRRVSSHSITRFGEITEELGYVEAGVVVGERIEDIGWGICQVSTTVFRHVFRRSPDRRMESSSILTRILRAGWLVTGSRCVDSSAGRRSCSTAAISASRILRTHGC